MPLLKVVKLVHRNCKSILFRAWCQFTSILIMNTYILNPRTANAQYFRIKYLARSTTNLRYIIQKNLFIFVNLLLCVTASRFYKHIIFFQNYFHVIRWIKQKIENWRFGRYLNVFTHWLSIFKTPQQCKNSVLTLFAYTYLTWLVANAKLAWYYKLLLWCLWISKKEKLVSKP